MIDYPEDQQLRDQASQHDLQAPVLIRDIVRVVEVLNLRAEKFFNKRSVLSGSMALRCFGSPRFTVYDADFSTSAATVDPPASMTELLRYSDENLDIVPAAATVADQRATLIQVEPIRFDAAFTGIALADEDRQFKADVSFRGLLLDGREVPFDTPYSLDLWSEAPAVWVMDPVEVLAEKILGWCVHGLVKHYADVAWITIAAKTQARDSRSPIRTYESYCTTSSSLCANFSRMSTERSPASTPSSASSPRHPNSTGCSGRSSSTYELTAPPTPKRTCAASCKRPSPGGCAAHRHVDDRGSSLVVVRGRSHQFYGLSGRSTPPTSSRMACARSCTMTPFETRFVRLWNLFDLTREGRPVDWYEQLNY
jgi:hypothetical protein